MDGRYSAISAAGLRFQLPANYKNKTEEQQVTSAKITVTKESVSTKKTRAKVYLNEYTQEEFDKYLDATNIKGDLSANDAYSSGKYAGKYTTGARLDDPTTEKIAESAETVNDTADQVLTFDVTDYIKALTGDETEIYVRLDSANDTNQDLKLYDFADANGDKKPKLEITLSGGDTPPAETATVTVTVDTPTNVNKVELKQEGEAKYTLDSNIQASNTISDVAYGTYDVVVTAADGYTATAAPAQLNVNAATATVNITTTKDVAELNDPTVAAGTSEEYELDGDVTYATGTATGVYKTATVKLKNTTGHETVAWSKNGNGTWGNWVGFTVAAPENYEITEITKSNDNTKVPEAMATVGQYDSNDTKDLVGYYVDASKDVADPYFFVKVKEVGGDNEQVYCYTIDVTDITCADQPKSTLTGAAPEADDFNTAYASFGKTLTDLVEDGYTATLGDNNTFTVSGTVKKVDDFSSLFGQADKEGYFMPLKLTGLKDKAIVYVESKTITDVDAVAENAIPGYTSTDSTTRYKKYTSSSFDTAPLNDNNDFYLILRKRDNSEAQKYKIIIDVDGEEGEYAPVLYTFDYSNIHTKDGDTVTKPSALDGAAAPAESDSLMGDDSVKVTDLASAGYAVTLEGETIKPAGILLKKGTWDKFGAGGKDYYLPIKLTVTEGTDIYATNNIGGGQTYPTVLTEDTTGTYNKESVKGTTTNVVFTLNDAALETYKGDKRLVIWVDEQDGDNEIKKPTKYTVDLSGIELMKEPAADDEGIAGETKLSSSTAIGDVEDLPEGITVEDLGTITFADATTETGYVKYTVEEGTLNSIEEKQYAAVKLTPPVESATKVAIVKGESEEAVKSAFDTVETVVDLKDIAVLDVTENKFYGIAFYKPTMKAASGFFQLMEVDNAEQIGDKIILDFSSGITVTKPTKLTAITGDNTTAEEGTASVHRVPSTHDFGSYIGKKASDLGTFTSEVGEDGVLKISGTAKYVDYTQADITDGYRVPIRVTVPDTDKGKAEFKLITKGAGEEAPSDSEWTNAKVEHCDGEKTMTTHDALVFLGGKDAFDNTKKSYLKVDLDGAETKYSWSDAVVVDYSGVKAEQITIAAKTLAAENGTLTLDKGAGDNEYTLNISNIKAHMNGQKKLGYWYGVGVTYPESYDTETKKVYFAKVAPSDNWVSEGQGFAIKRAEGGYWDGFWDNLAQEINTKGASYSNDDFKYYLAFEDGPKFTITVKWTGADVHTVSKGTVTGGTLKFAKTQNDLATATADQTLDGVAAGTTVYVKAENTEGYKAPGEDFTLNITGAEGVNATKVEGADNTTYTFTMPDKNVTVSADFEADTKIYKFTGTPEDGDLSGVTVPIFVFK